MAVPTTFPAGSRTGVSVLVRTLVQPWESIGTPADAVATDVADDNSALSLAKGIAVALFVPAGAGEGIVNPNPHINPDLLTTLGREGDPVAVDPDGVNSAISLLKGCCAILGL